MLRVSKVAAHVSAADCKTDMEREERRNDLVDDLAKKGAKMHAVPLQAIAAVKNRKRLTEDIQRMQVAILKLHDASRKKIGREQLNARVENYNRRTKVTSSISACEVIRQVEAAQNHFIRPHLRGSSGRPNETNTI